MVYAMGIRIRSYNTELFQGLKTDSAKIKKIKEYIEEKGIIGTPTMEKCRAFYSSKCEKEKEKESSVSELDLNNIITGGRVTRSRVGPKPKKDLSASPTAPASPKTSQEMSKRIRNVVDSESE